jgi:hypothetical protein
VGYRKIAIFVEGYTELAFVRRLFEEIAGYESTFVEEIVWSRKGLVVLHN